MRERVIDENVMAHTDPDIHGICSNHKAIPPSVKAGYSDLCIRFGAPFGWAVASNGTADK